jgi:hypothetical protein
MKGSWIDLFSARAHNARESSVNWLLQSRLDDNTRESHGWSYRTELIQIALLQEIRDALYLQTDLTCHDRNHRRDKERQMARICVEDSDDGETSEVIAGLGDDDPVTLIMFKGQGPLEAGEAAREVADRLNAVLDAARQQYRELLQEPAN